MDQWHFNDEMKDISRSSRRVQAKAEIAEQVAEADALWSVWRQDDNGQEYEVCRSVSLETAQARVAELESHGHKQLFWIQKTS